MQTKLKQNTNQMRTTCTQTTNKMQTKCKPKAHHVQTKCKPTANQMQTKCNRNTNQMSGRKHMKKTTSIKMQSHWQSNLPLKVMQHTLLPHDCFPVFEGIYIRSEKRPPV